MVMCRYNTLKHNKHGYVMQCNSCNHIQVAFATIILSLTVDQFYELIETADHLYNVHNLYLCRDEKLVQVPTAARSVAMIFTLNELKEFIGLLIGGRNKLNKQKLFVFNEN